MHTNKGLGTGEKDSRGTRMAEPKEEQQPGKGPQAPKTSQPVGISPPTPSLGKVDFLDNIHTDQLMESHQIGLVLIVCPRALTYSPSLPPGVNQNQIFFY